MIITINFLFTLFVLFIIFNDACKLNSSLIVFNIQLAIVVTKCAMLIFHIITNILFCKFDGFFMRFIKFQSVWLMLIFVICTHLSFYEEEIDIVVYTFGLYGLLPIMIIKINEKWQLTMPVYLLI